MPAGDGTGPVGVGPRTGRAAGYCSGYSEPGWANPAPGRGRRGGRGRRNWYSVPGVPGQGRVGYAPGEEVEFLKAQATWLERQLEAIGRRLGELASEK